MKSIAITGSFASGKTFVLKYLEKAGYKTFSCDERTLFRAKYSKRYTLSF